MHILFAIKRLRGHRHGTTDEVRMDPKTGRVFGGTQTEGEQAKILSAKPNGTIGRDGTVQRTRPASPTLQPTPWWRLGGLQTSLEDWRSEPSLFFESTIPHLWTLEPAAPKKCAAPSLPHAPRYRPSTLGSRPT